MRHPLIATGILLCLALAPVLEKQHGRWVIRQEMWNQGVAPPR